MGYIIFYGSNREAYDKKGKRRRGLEVKLKQHLRLLKKERVKRTVWHEIAHHFGFNEQGVRDLEKKRFKNV